LKERLGKKIKLEVSDIEKWQKMGTGSMTKEEILQDVTYFKMDTTSFEIKISNLPYEGQPVCKISWKDKEYKVTTNDLYEVINIVSKERLPRSNIEIFSWKDSGTTVGGKENSMLLETNELYEAINIISQLGTLKY